MKKYIVKKDNRKIKFHSDFQKIENQFGFKVPDVLKNFLLLYEGLYLNEEESYYKTKLGSTYEVNSVLYLYKSESGASIESILEGHLEEGIKGFVPFAIDSGGWDYCVSINQETSGQVWVDKFDSGEENPMEFVSESFEDFISNLGSEEDLV
ncbi:MAG: SMI1/KNR4 family protein [Cellulophaga sp.]